LFFDEEPQLPLQTQLSPSPLPLENCSFSEFNLGNAVEASQPSQEEPDETEKENALPSMDVLLRIMQGVEKLNARMDAFEKQLAKGSFLFRQDCTPVSCGGSTPESFTEPTPTGSQFSAAIKSAIDSAKPLKYWGECLHFTLRRPELFQSIIHWDSSTHHYWISNEDVLYQILATLKGSTAQRARESMKSRFFVKLTNNEAHQKEQSKDLVFDLYENKKRGEYTPASLLHPRVAISGSGPVEPTPLTVKQENLLEEEELPSAARQPRKRRCIR